MSVSTVKVLDGMEYVEYLPEDFDARKKHPVLLFLHGSGERGNLEGLKLHGPLYEVERGRKLPFVIVAPLCTGTRTWFDYGERLGKLLELYRRLPHVDADRIYVTGLSMGGYGTWSLAMAHPDKIAAIVPICGGGMVWNAPVLKDMPIWTFHGDCDGDVSIDETRRLVEAVQRAGNTQVKFTVYAGCNHNSWTATYANPEVYEWLLGHSLAR